MRKYTGLFAIVLFLIGSQAYAQKATERFIPIGESPGLSGKHTVIGTVDEVNKQTQTITVSDSSGSFTAKITDETRIWLDRSHLKLTNKMGAFTDIQMGRLIEVKSVGEEREGIAEWIKVRMNQ
ncbi:hypothetical protein GWO43_13005 [candidate division KSB1 bacterium]|nr:hypothetical protein [candidate division KSB1 bacterium]NIR71527.1 hypothetical protein [candidate division KSB1 bacterium]NIS24875.1 hypothetical protein [candidate division KSB1 bacterium]NIT71775.1 hypothetical protein [candidate division KSB1 bacterium]NIU25511.1 hypothetical protein [candidate division KSB1 bacterium]